ncbi:bola-like protein [Hyaloscypha variabilis F]|uniref:Bola-like protein n=1 Tax=Hyaloscypha variabilis (strain UAMH 11265 / GT02V1 / F) TaxID=1149755 RepID=A0A2J6R5A6_HYAVF|nr:bola-like protein [Hyaloscypha variabilis F]
MLRRSVLSFTRRPLSTMASQTPMEDTMRTKITEALRPSTLEIHNDSHLHSHHKAMAGSTSQETHFRVVITSEAFKSKMQPARHRMVYALLKEEMAREGGIHALQLRTRTLDEETKQAEREAAEKGESIDAKVDTA